MQNNYKKVISSKKSEAKKLMTDGQVVKCNVAIHTASVAAGTEAFIPIPGVDAVPITATQITMIIALGKIFDKKISESAAKAIIGAAASTFVGRSLVKLIPVAGWAISATVAAGVTEAIGWTVAVDFASQTSKVESNKRADEKHVISCDDIIYEAESNEDVDGGSAKVNDDQDDESISNDFSKMFGEGDE